MPNPFKGKHFLTVDTLTKASVSLIFEESKQMEELVKTQGSSDILKGKILAAIFYEPSTRTFTSFITAAQRLGAGIVPMLGVTATSVAKGETIEDTIRTLGCSADIITMRHPLEGSVKQAAKKSYVPIINAGDGTAEHPTQAILDTFTIHNHFDRLSDLTVGLIGDMKNGRTTHSLAKLLAKLGVKRLVFISPKELAMPTKITTAVKKEGAKILETDDLNKVIGDLDVLYDTRVQKERFIDENKYEELKDTYIITPKTMKKAKKKMILMHPLPRVGEITYEVDDDPRAVYIKEQMRNGVYTRMALLKLILE